MSPEAIQTQVDPGIPPNGISIILSMAPGALNAATNRSASRRKVAWKSPAVRSASSLSAAAPSSASSAYHAALPMMWLTTSLTVQDRHGVGRPKSAARTPAKTATVDAQARSMISALPRCRSVIKALPCRCAGHSAARRRQRSSRPKPVGGQRRLLARGVGTAAQELAAPNGICLDLELTLDSRVLLIRHELPARSMSMRYRTLGGTGIEVSTYCLGAMMFGSVGNPDHDDCVRIIHAALDHGINFVDTADMYSAGESEQIVGKALRGRRDDVVLATKVHFQMGEGRNRSGNSRRWILTEVDESLRRLQTDWIDLYQIHRPDRTTDIEETLSALSDLVHGGKIRAFGCSTFPAEEIVEAHQVSERRGLLRFRTEQPPYSILARGIERDILPVCQRYGMGVLTWSPLASSFLTGRYRKGQPADLSAGRAALTPARFDPAIPQNAAKFEAVEELAGLAASAGCSLPALAVAFTVAHPAVTSVITRPRTMQQLEDLLKGASVTLDDATLDRIDEIVPPGTDLYHPDGAWTPPSLADTAQRRRPLADRAAG